MTHSSAPSHAHTIRTAQSLSTNESVAIGVIGGTSVWLVYLFGDVFTASLFRTPAALGTGLLRLFYGSGPVSEVHAVITFTIWHYLTWMAIGALVLATVHLAAKLPSILIGLMLVVLFAQFLFIGFTLILAQSSLGASAWAVLLIGNAVGNVAIARYIRRRHPEIRRELEHAEDAD